MWIFNVDLIRQTGRCGWLHWSMAPTLQQQILKNRQLSSQKCYIALSFILELGILEILWTSSERWTKTLNRRVSVGGWVQKSNGSSCVNNKKRAWERRSNSAYFNMSTHLANRCISGHGDSLFRNIIIIAGYSYGDVRKFPKPSLSKQ